MILKSLTTDGYRNLVGETLQLENGINLLYGDNAAGKTNTLECAYLFASGRSFRARLESELIRHGSTTARAEMVLNRGGIDEHMALIYHKSKELGFVKRMLYQGFEVSKASEFLGIFRAVLFTPDHLSLIKGSPEERRRFMDIALSQLNPKYVYVLNQYLKILSQKNAYLKQVQMTGKADEAFLEVLDCQLAKAAAVVIRQRAGLAGRLKEYAGSFYATLADNKECLDVRYLSATKSDYEDVTLTEERLMHLYKADKDSEKKQGRTIHGPHKDDLMIYIQGADMMQDVPQEADSEETGKSEVSEFAARTFGSQGQQRSAVLAIKLAEGEIFKELTGSYPVFLLDDLLGELDVKRRKVLMELIKDKQAIITCCDRTAMPELKHVTAVQVVNGAYIPAR